MSAALDFEGKTRLLESRLLKMGPAWGHGGASCSCKVVSILADVAMQVGAHHARETCARPQSPPQVCTPACCGARGSEACHHAKLTHCKDVVMLMVLCPCSVPEECSREVEELVYWCQVCSLPMLICHTRRVQATAPAPRASA